MKETSNYSIDNQVNRRWQLAMRCLTYSFLALCFLLGASSARANDIFVAQNAIGAGSGADCANARAASWFNTSTSWGSGTTQIGPGTTVHLCGTISSGLTLQGSGTSGNPVTILFEAGAKISMPACPALGCLNLDNRSWIVIDGGGPGGTNGVIESSANGTGLGVQVQGVRGIQMDYSNNVIVQNLLIQNMYVHKVTPLDTVPSAPDPTCVHLFGSSNVSIHHNTMHDANWCLFGGGGGNNISIYNNDIYNVDHMVGIGVISNTTDTVVIHDNHFHDAANWDTSATACSGSSCYHHDGIHVYQTSGGSIKNISIYNNLFDGDWGVYNTAQIYTEGVNFTMTVFNNVFVGTVNNRNLNNGAMCLTVGPQGTVRAYNNTVTGSSSQSNALVKFEGSVDFRNNVVTGSQALIWMPSDVTFVSGGMNYNVWGGSGSPFYVCAAGSCGFQTFSSFKNLLPTASGKESNSLFTSDLGLNLTGVPIVGSAVIGTGANLTSLNIIPLDSDKLGVKRSSTALFWDAGAYASGGSPAPAAPSSLTATVQ